tara:strand:- start:212 stop:745 length:534 start_codon:yes stop_codon:yes gene_type:complete
MPSTTSSPTEPLSLRAFVESADENTTKLQEGVVFSAFSGLSVPSNATITGAKLVVTGAFNIGYNASTATSMFTISADGGDSYGDTVTASSGFNALSDGISTVTYGGPTTLWGIGADSWNAVKTNLDEKLALRYIAPNSSVAYFDYINIGIYYSVTTTGTPIKLITGRVQLINGRISI